MTGTFAFLPNLRPDLLAQAGLDASGHLGIDISVTIIGDGQVQGPAIQLPTMFRGPGEVVGIDQAQILRSEPDAGMTGFPFNFLPFIEFRDPDFPWRYSLDEGLTDRLRPWLALLALRANEFSWLPQGVAPSPSILVKDIASSLPDITQGWAHAHTQIDLSGSQASGIAALREDPDCGFSRLFCLRRLEPDTAYTLFLVPAWKAGVLAGLGEDPAQAQADPAWQAGQSASITLPYYHRISFTTSAAFDLENQLRKLKAIDPSTGSGAGNGERVLSHRPGYYPGFSSDETGFTRQAALVRPGQEPRREIEEKVLVPLMQDTLNEVIRGEQIAADDNSEEDPLIAFPPYGMHYGPFDDVSVNQINTRWFDRLNLDLRWRDAAALGARIVLEKQEEFAAAAWEQYDEIVAANAAMARLRASEVLAARIDRTRFSKLPGDVALALAEPFHAYAPASRDLGKHTTVDDLMRDAGTPQAYASRDMRRFSATRPQRDRKTGARVIASPALPGDTTPGPASHPRKDSALRKIEAHLAASLADAPMNRARTLTRQVYGRNRDFTTRTRQQQVIVPVVAFSSEQMRASLSDGLGDLPMLKAKYVLGGLSEAEGAAAKPVWRTPRLTAHMVDELQRVERGAIISAIDDLPPNSVSLFEENRHFIEALMAGANHAMNDELRWRGFPTDLRGTIFQRFWNRGFGAGSRRGDDIGAIAEWDKPLGHQFSPANPDGTRGLIMVVRSEAIRIMGDAIVVINVADHAQWEAGKGENIEPQFWGRLGRDIAYWGFDVSAQDLAGPMADGRAFFVISEPPGRLRFGLDTERVQPMATWDDMSWDRMTLDDADWIVAEPGTASLPKPSAEPSNLWGPQRNAAGIARSFWQKPVAAVLPLRRMIDGEG